MSGRRITLDPRWSKLAASNNYTKGETKWRRMLPRLATQPFSVSHSNAKSKMKERESRRKRKIEEQIGREKESFSPNFFSSKEQLLEIESLKFSPPSSEKSSTRFFPRRRIILHLRGREEEKKRRCFDKQQSHLSNSSLVFFCIYERFVR